MVEFTIRRRGRVMRALGRLKVDIERVLEKNRWGREMRAGRTANMTDGGVGGVPR